MAGVNWSPTPVPTPAIKQTAQSGGRSMWDSVKDWLSNLTKKQPVAQQPEFNTYSPQQSSGFQYVGPTQTAMDSASRAPGGGGGAAGSGRVTGGSNGVDIQAIVNRIKASQPPVDTSQIQTGVSDADLDAIYAGQYSALENRARSINEGLPLTLEQLKTQGEALKAPYEERLEQGLSEYDTSERGTRAQQLNALQQMRQVYNELAQRNMSRFGTGGSIGQAAMELLGRATQGQFGGITNTATENLAKIDAGRTQLKNFVTKAKAQLDKEVQNKIDLAQQWVKDRIGEINAQKDMLASEKADKKYQALQARANIVNEITARGIDYGMQIDQWAAQESIRQSQNLAGLRTPVVDPNAVAYSAEAGLPRMIAATGPGYTNYQNWNQSLLPTINTSSSGLTGRSPAYYQDANGVWRDQYGNMYNYDPRDFLPSQAIA